MKAVFGIDWTTDKKNEHFDGEAFITAKVMDSQTDALVRDMESLEDTEFKTDFPKPLQIIYYIVLILAIIFTASFLTSISKVGVYEMWENAPVLVLVGTATIMLAGFLFLLKKARAKILNTKLGLDEELEQAEERVEKRMEASWSMLGVPEDARDVDILTYHYKRKGEELKVREQGIVSYANVEVKIWLEENALCIADLESRLTLPISEIREIRMIKKRINFMGWNKETPWDSKIYKAYKPTCNQFGQVFMNPYYKLMIDHAGEAFELAFLPYELPAFQELLPRVPMT